MANDELEIRRLVSTWPAASRAGDVEAVLDLMADDVVFLVPGRAPMGKAESIERAGDTLSVLQRIGGKWLVARDANLLTQAQPQAA